MSEKLDRRKARTREQLRKALIEIMEEKGPDRVTVSDLTEKPTLTAAPFICIIRMQWICSHKLKVKCGRD
ncbi:hypothetical protein P4H67_17050 [Paenibacillus lautus]|uniref:hypothetical protein n=1 Tax=Paenibacillus lautus TaxID=1401 RepID=UPI002DBD094E|nr:hypothetical protein [Paenibacillus lautus]MEC0308461.1 hypothetical protein [Paenibacillus lautus]